MHKNRYDTVVAAISDLQARGFFLDFTIVGDKLLCAQEKCYVGADEFDVLEKYSFYAGGQNANVTVVYAIESFFQAFRGVLLCSGSPTKTGVSHIFSRKMRKTS
jgi:hypothetical protein